MNGDDHFRQIRKEYCTGKLDERELNSDPFIQFKQWFDASMSAQIVEPNACALATCSTDGKPSLRMVLLKGLDQHGLIFYTNYRSVKGAQIEANPNAALLFYWADFERQVRVEGHVERISDAESDSYFRSRPRDAQVGAIVSRQSSPVASREAIDQAAQEFSTRNADAALQRPEHWGGYRVVPESFEFWQGRENRLHDRLRYVKDGSVWRIERLWP